MPPTYRQALQAIWLLLVLGVILGSLAPAATPGVKALLRLDKAVHFSAYALLAFVPILAFVRRRLAFTASGSMALLGAALEMAQTLAHRTMDGGDIAANLLGVAIGVLIGLPFRV